MSEERPDGRWTGIENQHPTVDVLELVSKTHGRSKVYASLHEDAGYLHSIHSHRFP